MAACKMTMSLLCDWVKQFLYTVPLTQTLSRLPAWVVVVVLDYG